MYYHVPDIMRDIRICIDQNMVSTPLLADGDIDTLSMDDIIYSKIEEAVRRVHSTAPASMLEHGHNLITEDDATTEVYWGEMESGWVLLPDDFMRLVVFEMSDWERPVYIPISPSDPEYVHQRSRIKALRGTPQRPVCAIGIRPEGKVLEFYSCADAQAYISRGVYIPYPHIDDDGYIDISERCYMPVVYIAASLASASVGSADLAKVLSDLAQSLMQ